jgi:serine/threonine-protein kinase
MRRLLPARLRAALQPQAAARYEPPADVLRASRQRVRIAALLGTAGYALYFAFELSGLLPMSALERRIDVVQNGISLALCLTLLGVAAWSTLDDRWVLTSALVAEALITALISIADPWASFLHTGNVPGLTWVVPIIILFALLVPAQPRTTLLFSVLCAATMPAGLLVLSSVGQVTVGAGDYVAALAAGGVAVGIASVAARAVYGAGEQIAAARRVGSYELEEPIGRGGAGEVWRGRHLLLARPAAVKLILPETLQGPREARDKALARFTREAQVTAELTSPHTVRLYDFGIGDEQSLYYVMELLDGLNLQHFVYQYGALEPRRAVHVLAQACHSLGEAHARGLIHRDVKPSNLFLCTIGRDRDVVKVLDFGLSRAASDQGESALTREGAVAGTPGYMAPEQIYGSPAGPAADLYALGCVAYWLLTATTPFESDEPGVLARMHAQSPVPPLRERSKHAIPPRLETLVMACLAKESRERPHDADCLRADLLTSIDEPPWTAADASAWWDRQAAVAARHSELREEPGRA